MNSGIIAALAGVLMFSQTPPVGAADSVSLKDQKEKASYSIGLNIGTNLKQQGLDLITDALAAGLKDALTGGKPLLSDEEIRDALSALQTEMMGKRAASLEVNKKEGDAFLAANKSKEGVTVLPSGLQYKVITTGAGKKPKTSDAVRTHYRGTLINGTEFDSSYKRGEPVSFQVNQVIAGWTEALQLMPIGSKWQLFIPSNLAYGERGQDPIPPNSTLIFDIELLGVEEGKEP